MDKQKRTKRLRLTSIAMIGLGGTAFLGWNNWPPQTVATSAAVETAAPAPLPVQTLEIASVASYEVRREYTGEVAAPRASELGFEGAGKVVWLGVDRGNRVAAGDLLARLDTRNLEAQRQQLVARRDRAVALLDELQTGPRQEDISAAEAAVRELEDQIALDEIRRDRREYLQAEGAISLEQLDEVAYRLDSLRDRRRVAVERLRELQNGTRTEQIAAQRAAVRELDAAIADVDIAIDKSQLRAPFSGTIGARHLDEGTVAAAGESVFRLVERQRQEVEIGIPVAAVTDLPREATVTIGDRAYSARLKALLPEIDSATRTRTAIYELPLDASEAVAPGEIARLELVQAMPTQGFWLPTTALARGDRGLWAAYAVVPVGGVLRLERRDVEVLHTEGDRVLVRGTLQSGDRLVASGIARVVPGQIVRLSQ